jgi:hypothetical protein
MTAVFCWLCRHVIHGEYSMTTLGPECASCTQHLVRKALSRDNAFTARDAQQAHNDTERKEP